MGRPLGSKNKAKKAVNTAVKVTAKAAKKGVQKGVKTSAKVVKKSTKKVTKKPSLISPDILTSIEEHLRMIRFLYTAQAADRILSLVKRGYQTAEEVTHLDATTVGLLGLKDILEKAGEDRQAAIEEVKKAKEAEFAAQAQKEAELEEALNECADSLQTELESTTNEVKPDLFDIVL